MTDRVPAEDIERIVGAQRHQTLHQARAVSAEQTVYVLHSQECLDSGIDLNECRYSLALDNGIRVDEWTQDEPVVVQVAGAFNATRLRPDALTRRCGSCRRYVPINDWDEGICGPCRELAGATDD